MSWRVTRFGPLWAICAAVAALFLLRPARAAGAAPRVEIAPSPAWALPEQLPSSYVPSRGGIALLSLDRQTRQVGSECWQFFRSVVRIDSEAGTRQAGKRELGFSPPHQRLVLHKVQLERGGARLSRLRPDAIQLLQRETRLDNDVYDGQRTALILLSDVRVGDVIRYEYSIIGQNPVLAHHVSANWQLQFESAVGFLRYRLVSDKQLSGKAFAANPEVVTTKVGALIVYEYSAEDVPAITPEPGLPQDTDAIPWLELTDFHSWAEVIAWAEPLFALPEPLAQNITQVVEQIKRDAHAPRERARLALRFVQQNVRYFALDFGESSHRPTRPELVLERGFGDCKDKSLLALTLFRALGLEAQIALVHTTYGAKLPRLLPAIGAFNHAIVALSLDGSRYFLDPTRSYQRGDLSELSLGLYDEALLIDEAQPELVPIAHASAASEDIHSTLSFRIRKFGGRATLNVDTFYYGVRAELIRGLEAGGEALALKEFFSAPVRQLCAKASPMEEPNVLDFDTANRVEVTQNFDLSECWFRLSNGQTALSIAPIWLAPYVPTLHADRHDPLGIEYPLHVVSDISVSAPYGLPVPFEPVNQHTVEYDFSFAGSVVADKPLDLLLHYDLATRKNTIEPARFASYRKSLADVQNTLAFSAWRPIFRRPASMGWLMLLTALWAGVVLALAFLVQLRQPYWSRPSVPWLPELKGRRDWLALLGINTTLAPITLLLTVARSLRVYTGASWATLTDISSASYQPAYPPVLIVELLGNTAWLIGASYAAYLYWAGRRSFPLVLVVVRVCGAAFLIADELIASGLDLRVTHETGSTPVWMYVPVSIAWCAYALSSRRVKATFLPPPERPADNPVPHGLDTEPASVLPTSPRGGVTGWW